MTLTTTAVRSDADTIMEGWYTGATPPEFAPPLGADDDGSTLLVAFDVADVQLDSLAVEVSENAVVIHGDANPAIKHAGKITRYFALPPGLDPTTTQTRYDGKVLMVRLQRPSSEPLFKTEELADEDDDDIATVEDLFELPPLRGEAPRARSWAYTPRKGRRGRRSSLVRSRLVR